MRFSMVSTTANHWIIIRLRWLAFSDQFVIEFSTSHWMTVSVLTDCLIKLTVIQWVICCYGWLLGVRRRGHRTGDGHLAVLQHRALRGTRLPLHEGPGAVCLHRPQRSAGTHQNDRPRSHAVQRSRTIPRHSLPCQVLAIHWSIVLVGRWAILQDSFEILHRLLQASRSFSTHSRFLWTARLVWVSNDWDSLRVAKLLLKILSEIPLQASLFETFRCSFFFFFLAILCNHFGFSDLSAGIVGRFSSDQNAKVKQIDHSVTFCARQLLKTGAAELTNNIFSTYFAGMSSRIDELITLIQAPLRSAQ